MTRTIAKLTNRRMLLAAAGTTILVAGGAVLVVGGSQPPRLPGLSNSDLANQGIVLKNPSFPRFTGQSQAAAERIAIRYVGDPRTKVRGSVLAQFHFVANPSIDCLCWVISVEPPGFGGFSQPESDVGQAWAVRFYLVVVDANTGRVAFSREAG